MLFLTQELSGKTIKQTNVFPIDRRSVLQRHLFSCCFPPLRVAGEDQSGFEVTRLLEECGGPTGECICQNFAEISLSFEDKSELKAQLPGKQVSFSQEAGIHSLHSSLATTLREPHGEPELGKLWQVWKVWLWQVGCGVFEVDMLKKGQPGDEGTQLCHKPQKTTNQTEMTACPYLAHEWEESDSRGSLLQRVWTLLCW